MTFSALTWTHTIVGILLALCALVFSWTPVGRRVVNAVAGVQLIVGLIVAGFMGANHIPLPKEIWGHIVVGILIVAAFGIAMSRGKRAGNARQTLMFSIVGIVLTLLNLYLGTTMARVG